MEPGALGGKVRDGVGLGIRRTLVVARSPSTERPPSADLTGRSAQGWPLAAVALEGARPRCAACCCQKQWS
jgi:hypothetical protein